MQGPLSTQVTCQQASTKNTKSSADEAPLQPPLDPFHRNYTLTGLVNHIQSTVHELISSKRAFGTSHQAVQQSQMQKLLKIQQQVAVLKNIIVFNLNQIFNNLYPGSLQLMKGHSRNSRGAEERGEQADDSLTIVELQPENGENYGRINNLEMKTDRLSYYQSKQSTSTEDKETKSEAESTINPLRDVQKHRQTTKITPFRLELQEQAIKVEEQDAEGDKVCGDQFDLLCYEDEKSIQGYRGIKAKEEESEREFSPIEQRAAEEQQTAQKGVPVKGNITFNNFGRDLSVSVPSKKGEINRRLFTYTGIVLPKRLSRKKFNYLQQISERRA